MKKYFVHLQNNLAHNWLTVVYFDQKIGAAHHVRWSKYCLFMLFAVFLALQILPSFLLKRGEKKELILVHTQMLVYFMV